ncbi:MAG: hypothetical protein ACREA0_15985 [bacterium]
MFIIALLVGRWWIGVLPVIGWPLFFLGLNLGWWGYGVGDFWEQAMVLYMSVGVAAVTVGLLFRGFLLPAVRSRRRGG